MSRIGIVLRTGALATVVVLATFGSVHGNSQTLDGLWQGIFDINGQGQYDFTALYVDGQVAGFSTGSNVVYRGTVVGDDQQYHSNMLMYIRDGTRFGTVQLNGTVANEARSIVARYRTTGEDTGTLGLIYDSLFDRDVRLPSLIGLWEHTSEELSISVNVDKTGALTGTDSAGCNYYGRVQETRPGINAFQVTVEVASCSTADGHYEGMLHVADKKSRNDTLHLSMTNDQFGMYFPLTRVPSAS